MSVRVIIKDVKKRTKACDECKRRKGRCDGGMPCEWCAARNLECVFSAFSQKRGPKKKKRSAESDNEGEEEILTLDKREQGMTHDLELNNYLAMYLKYLDPLFTMFNHWDKGARLAQLTNPRSYSQFITKYAACAIAARACGHKERAVQLISEARSFAGQCFDDMSVDGLVGFLLLSSYWCGLNAKVTKHYMNIALSMFAAIPHTTLPANIRYIMTISAVMLNNAISDTDKLKVFMATSKTIVAQNNVQSLMGSFLRLCLKAFCHMKCLDPGQMRSDIVAVLLTQVFFSERQRASILDELQVCKDLANICTDIENVRNTINLLFSSLEIFIEWRSGHPENALPIAIDYANKCSLDVVKFGNRFDVEHLLMISIFLREQQHLALADKVRKIAEGLHTQVCEALPDLSSSADSLASYLRRKPIVQQQHAFLVLSPPPSPSPSPSPSSSQDPYSAIDDNMVPAMVDNVLSLVSQLLPDQSSLLSAQGLHLFYNTLSSILPPSPSPYEMEIDEPIVEVENDTVSNALPSNNNNAMPNFDHPTYTFNIQQNSTPIGTPAPTPPQNQHSPNSSVPSPSSSVSSPSLSTPPITPPVSYPSSSSSPNEPMEQIYTISQDPNNVKNNGEIDQIMSVEFPFPAHSFSPFSSTLPVLFRNYTQTDETPDSAQQNTLLYATTSSPNSTYPIPSVTPMAPTNTMPNNATDGSGINFMFQRVNNLIANSNNNTNNATMWNNQGVNSPNLHQQSTPHTATFKGAVSPQGNPPEWDWLDDWNKVL